VQRSFGVDWLLQVGYVGTTGVDCRDSSRAIASVCSRLRCKWQPKLDNGGGQRKRASSLFRCTLEQPQTAFIVRWAKSPASQFQLQRSGGQPAKALQPRSVSPRSYTWSHSIDDISSLISQGRLLSPWRYENDLAQDPFDLAAERGRSMFDARHRFVLIISGPTFCSIRATGTQGDGQLAVEWNLDGDERHTFHGIRLERCFTAGAGAGDLWVFQQRPNVVGNPNSGPVLRRNGST